MLDYISLRLSPETFLSEATFRQEFFYLQKSGGKRGLINCDQRWDFRSVTAPKDELRARLAF